MEEEKEAIKEESPNEVKTLEEKARLEEERKLNEEYKPNSQLVISFDFRILSLLCSISSVVFMVITKLFYAVNVLVAGQIFIWFAGIALVGGLIFYLMSVIKKKLFAVNAELVSIIVAIAFFAFAI